MGGTARRAQQVLREALLVYLKVKIVFALAIRTTHPPSWPLWMYL